MVAPDLFEFLTQDDVFGSKDLANYWYAVKRLLEGRDPYNSSEDPGPPYFGTPGFLLITLFLGKVSLQTASLILTVLNIILLVSVYHACVYFLFPLVIPQSSYPSKEFRRLCGVICALFFPVLQVITIGQVALISTFFLTAFLVLFQHRSTKAQITAGLLLSITTAKPHTLALFYLYVIFVSFRFNRHALVSGFLCGAGILHLAPVFFYPNLYSRYFEVALSGGEWMTPTLGAWLKFLWRDLHVPLQFLPLLIGSLFLTRKSRHLSGELQEALLVITASVVCAPYLWTYDFSLLLPGLLLLPNRQAPLAVIKRVVAFTLFMLVLLWVTAKNMEYTVWFPLVLFVLQLSNHRGFLRGDQNRLPHAV